MNVYKSFKFLEVLHDVSLTIQDGEVAAIIVPSGSGKSTLLRGIDLLEHPTSGHIFVDGADVVAPKVNIQQIRQKVRMPFQHFNLFPHMTVLQNITYTPVKVLQMDAKHAQEKFLALLDRAGLADYPATLSGGQKQRVAIARTPAMDPKSSSLMSRPARWTPRWSKRRPMSSRTLQAPAS